MRLPTALVVLALSSTLTAQPRPRPKDVAGSINSIWQMERDQFLSLAEAMPADKWGFAPQQGAFKDVRSFAQQVKHVACANFGFAREIRKEEPPPGCMTGGPDPANTKAELMKYLRDSVALLDGAISGTTTANMLDPVDGPYGGPNTRIGIAVLAAWHLADHYGQLVVYARMNGIVPPASTNPPPPAKPKKSS